jgi:citrate lyase beta subunit
VGVVGAADQRAALDVPEAHLEAELAEAGELLRRVVAAHRQVVLRRAEILADGQDVHVVLPQVEHGTLDLLFRLP